MATAELACLYWASLTTDVHAVRCLYWRYFYVQYINPADGDHCYAIILRLLLLHCFQYSPYDKRGLSEPSSSGRHCIFLRDVWRVYVDCPDDADQGVGQQCDADL